MSKKTEGIQHCGNLIDRIDQKISHLQIMSAIPAEINFISETLFVPKRPNPNPKTDHSSDKENYNSVPENYQLLSQTKLSHFHPDPSLSHPSHPNISCQRSKDSNPKPSPYPTDPSHLKSIEKNSTPITFSQFSNQNPLFSTFKTDTDLQAPTISHPRNLHPPNPSSTSTDKLLRESVNTKQSFNINSNSINRYPTSEEPYPIQLNSNSQTTGLRERSSINSKNCYPNEG